MATTDATTTPTDRAAAALAAAEARAAAPARPHRAPSARMITAPSSELIAAALSASAATARASVVTAVTRATLGGPDERAAAQLGALQDAAAAYRAAEALEVLAAVTGAVAPAALADAWRHAHDANAAADALAARVAAD